MSGGSAYGPAPVRAASLGRRTGGRAVRSGATRSLTGKPWPARQRRPDGLPSGPAPYSGVWTPHDPPRAGGVVLSRGGSFVWWRTPGPAITAHTTGTARVQGKEAMTVFPLSQPRLRLHATPTQETHIRRRCGMSASDAMPGCDVGSASDWWCAGATTVPSRTTPVTGPDTSSAARE